MHHSEVFSQSKLTFFLPRRKSMMCLISSTFVLFRDWDVFCHTGVSHLYIAAIWPPHLSAEIQVRPRLIVPNCTALTQTQQYCLVALDPHWVKAVLMQFISQLQFIFIHFFPQPSGPKKLSSSSWSPFGFLTSSLGSLALDNLQKEPFFI